MRYSSIASRRAQIRPFVESENKSNVRVPNNYLSSMLRGIVSEDLKLNKSCNLHHKLSKMFIYIQNQLVCTYYLAPFRYIGLLVVYLHGLN